MTTPEQEARWIDDDSRSPLEIAPPMPYELIEWRVDSDPFESVSGGYRCAWVAYIDARHAARQLDEWVGPANWRTSFATGPKDGSLWCKLEIRDPVTQDWVHRSDVGEETTYAAVKGMVSDAFKRAAVQWGIARNVYALPQVWATCGSKTKQGKTTAVRHKDSATSILAELKAQGVDVKSTMVAEVPEAPGDEPDEVAEPPERDPNLMTQEQFDTFKDQAKQGAEMFGHEWDRTLESLMGDRPKPNWEKTSTGDAAILIADFEELLEGEPFDVSS